MEAIVRNAVTVEQKTTRHPKLIEGPRIIVMGSGGAGNNTLNRMARLGVSGAELIAVNTDKQHLTLIHDSVKILIDLKLVFIRIVAYFVASKGMITALKFIRSWLSYVFKSGVFSGRSKRLSVELYG